MTETTDTPPPETERAPVVLAIDPSLSCTGFAVHGPAGWDIGKIDTKALPKDASHIDHADRIEEILRRLHGHLIEIVSRRGYSPGARPFDLLVIEQPAYASKTGNVTERAALFMTAIRYFRRFSAASLVVVGGTRCKYATGNGGAGKPEVMAAAIKMHPDAAHQIVDDNTADAVILADVGAYVIEAPIVDVPKAHLEGAILKLEPIPHPLPKGEPE